MEEIIKSYYLTGWDIQDIYNEVGSRRQVDKIIKGFNANVKQQRTKYLADKRRNYKNDKNKEYRNTFIFDVKNVHVCTKRQHFIDVNILSAEKY